MTTLKEVIKEAEKYHRRRNPPKTLEIPVWLSYAGWLINKDSLRSSHPRSYYNYIKNMLGLDPEDYGVFFEIRKGGKTHRKLFDLGKAGDDHKFPEIKEYASHSTIKVDDDHYLYRDLNNEVSLWKIEKEEV